MENTNATPMTTEMAFDAMEKLLPHLAAVVSDPEVKRAADYVKTEEGKKTPVFDILPTLLPLFITRHREDMMHIVAAFKGVTVEEVRALPFRETVMVMRENLVGDMLLFFMLCLRMANAQ